MDYTSARVSVREPQCLIFTNFSFKNDILTQLHYLLVCDNYAIHGHIGITKLL